MSLYQKLERAFQISPSPSLAEKMCAKHSMSFADVFRQQYRFLHSDIPAPDGFVTRRVGSWVLHHCPSLPMTTLTDSRNQVVGYCLGPAVDGEGQRLREFYALPGTAGAKGFLDQAEQAITWFAGRYVIFLNAAKKTRVYGDPAGSFPLVYNAKEKTVASSLLLALSRDIIPNPEFDTAAISGIPDFDKHAINTSRVPAKGGFSFGHTADGDVKRLTPNHRLSLEDFSVARFWPAPDHQFPIGALTVKQAALKLSKRLGTVCNALIDGDPAWIAMSGGLDSRMMLAASIDGFTPGTRLYSHAMNRSSHLDTISADKVAQFFGHELHAVVPPSGPFGDFHDKDRQAFEALRHDLSTGFVAPLGEHIMRGALSWIPKDDLLVRGNMLELISGVWWPRMNRMETTDPIAHAVYRCQVSATNDTQSQHREDAMKQWISTLPGNAAEVMHDFSYVENTLPYTQSGLMSVNHCLFVAPACDRRVFEICMNVPINKRLRGRFYHHMIGLTHPGLFDVPLARDIAAERRAQKASGIAA